MTHALHVGRMSRVVLAATFAVSVLMFAWPLVVGTGTATGTLTQGHQADAPYVFVGLLPVILAVVLTQLSDGGMDAKTLAMLGILSGVGAALRPLGTGVAGIEPMFFLLVIAGRVFGAGFGFALGALSLLCSALVTGGVGPWLPFQMIAAGWVGLGAGLLPRRARGWLELGLLAAYGAAAALIYGLAMNLWFWPFVVGPDAASGLGFQPGGGAWVNLGRFLRYSVVTSLTWDIGRVLTTVAMIAVLGRAVLVVLRRAARRAGWLPAQPALGSEPALGSVAAPPSPDPSPLSDSASGVGAAAATQLDGATMGAS